jgi:oligosaccharide repeat unit polymerase
MSSFGLLYILLALSLILLVAVPLFQYSRRGRQDLFEPVYLGTIIFFLMFWVRSIHLLWAGSYIFGDPPFTPGILRAWNLAWIYLIMAAGVFFAAYYSNFGKTLASKFSPLPAGWSGRAARRMIYILFFGGLCAYFVLVSRYGGLGSFLARRQGVEPTLGMGVADVETLRNAVVLSALAAFAAALSAKKHMRMFLLIFVIALVLSVAAGGRSDVIFPLFSLLMMDHYLRKPKKLRHFVVLGLITAMVISPLMIIFRDGLRPSEVAWTSDEVSGRGGVTAFMERMGGVESLAIIIRDTPDVMNYQYGATLAYIFVAWVPRYLWEDKPPSFTQIFPALYLRDFFDPGTVGFAPTIFGEAYVNFHFPGILMVALIGGWLLRALYEHLIARKRTISGVFIYSATLPFIIIGLESHFAALLLPAWTLFLTWFSCRWVAAEPRNVPAC